MGYDVIETTMVERPTAVIADLTTWAAFPALWPVLLDEVWKAVRPVPSIEPGRNVMLYEPEASGHRVRVEIGVEASGAFAPIGRVVPGVLPGGRIAATIHRGRYEDLDLPHTAIVDWCARTGLERAGPRWEVYGHANEQSAVQTVEVFYLLR